MHRSRPGPDSNFGARPLLACRPRCRLPAVSVRRDGDGDCPTARVPALKPR
jgi:hypothetical protein